MCFSVWWAELIARARCRCVLLHCIYRFELNTHTQHRACLPNKTSYPLSIPFCECIRLSDGAPFSRLAVHGTWVHVKWKRFHCYAFDWETKWMEKKKTKKRSQKCFSFILLVGRGMVLTTEHWSLSSRRRRRLGIAGVSRSIDERETNFELNMHQV